MFRRSSFPLLVFFLFVIPATAQTTHVVTVSGVTFSPDMLTIEAGDTVRWENVGGVHNVSATLGDYPGNPEGFRSGDPMAAPWNYEYTFTLVGDYGYYCEVHGVPGSGMIGEITVDAGTGIGEEVPGELNIRSVYPNPFRSGTVIEFALERSQTVRVAIFDALGREIDVLHDGPMPAGAPVRLEWTPSGERSGVYAIDVQGETFHTTRKVIRVR